ncbi:MAG TPA: hypothetical protein VJR05_06125 [Acidimicrobiia bacterium]|nr:hypothetical protein [Acidimicrobiia bacterium]
MADIGKPIRKIRIEPERVAPVPRKEDAPTPAPAPVKPQPKEPVPAER